MTLLRMDIARSPHVEAAPIVFKREIPKSFQSCLNLRVGDFDYLPQISG